MSARPIVFTDQVAADIAASIGESISSSVQPLSQRIRRLEDQLIKRELADIEAWLHDARGFTLLVDERRIRNSADKDAPKDAELIRAQAFYRGVTDRLRLTIRDALSVYDEVTAERASRLLRCFMAHWQGGAEAVHKALQTAGVIPGRKAANDQDRFELLARRAHLDSELQTSLDNATTQSDAATSLEAADRFYVLQAQRREVAAALSRKESPS